MIHNCLSRHNLLLAELAAKEASRFTLNGILVTPDATVVTDGHQLSLLPTSKIGTADSDDAVPVICGRQPLATWTPFILGAADCKRILSAIPKRSHLSCMMFAYVLEVIPAVIKDYNVVTPGRAVIGIGGQSAQVFECTMPNGNFPDYERVMPKEPRPFQIAFNGALLGQLMTLVKKTGDERLPMVTMHFVDSKSTAVITANTNDLQELKMVIMPCKADQNTPFPECRPSAPEPAAPVDISPMVAAVMKQFTTDLVAAAQRCGEVTAMQRVLAAAMNPTAGVEVMDATPVTEILQ